jgi:hypothetical protein
MVLSGALPRKYLVAKMHHEVYTPRTAPGPVTPSAQRPAKTWPAAANRVQIRNTVSSCSCPVPASTHLHKQQQQQWHWMHDQDARTFPAFGSLHVLVSVTGPAAYQTTPIATTPLPTLPQHTVYKEWCCSNTVLCIMQNPVVVLLLTCRQSVVQHSTARWL